MGAAIGTAALVGAGMLTAAAPALADYGNTAVYQIELSANISGHDGGGAWLWLELSSDGSVDYQGSDCGHAGQGAVHDSRPLFPGIGPDAPVDHDFEPGFMVDLIYKDLGLAIAAGRRYGVPLQLVATAQQIFGAASALGYGRKDLSAVKFAVEAISKSV